MRNYYLGIDIGSVAIAIAVIDDENQILHTYYDFHKGQILKKLCGIVQLDFIQNIHSLLPL